MKSLVGSAVGSRVLIALSPKEGLAANAKSNGAKNVKKDDTLLYVVDVKSVRTPWNAPPAKRSLLPTAARGHARRHGKPTIEARATPPRANSSCSRSSREPAPPSPRARRSRRTTRLDYRSGKRLTRRGTGDARRLHDRYRQDDPGWDAGLVGQTVGSQVLLVVPPDQGTARAGTPKPASAAPTRSCSSSTSSTLTEPLAQGFSRQTLRHRTLDRSVHRR